MPGAPETISFSEFKAKCLEILRRVQKTGRPVVVTRRGQHIAEIRPPSHVDPKAGWLGSFADRGQIIGDLVEPIASSR
jgi:prevent-host-death family protein